MTQPWAPAAPRPRRVWYGIALALFALSLAPAFLLGRHAVSVLDVDIRTPDSRLVSTSTSERAVWVDSQASVSDAVCDIRRGGSDSVFIAGLAEGANLTLSHDGRAWTRVAILPADEPARWRLVCSSGSGRVPLQSLGLSQNPDLRAFTLSIVLAFVIPIVAAVVAGAVVIAVALRRRRARRPVAESYLAPPPAY